jgi:hypothetical protein
MKCDICGMKVEGFATGLINIEVDDGWVEVADEVSSFIHDECFSLVNEQWRNRNKDLLYVLTISGDLADYYDSTAGRKEGDFDALTPEQQQSMAHYVEKALDGFMEDRYIAFDTGIDDSGL